MKQKKGVYRREGRSPKWRRLRKLLQDLIERRREKYCGSQKDALLASDGERAFFKNIKCYSSHDRQEQFDVLSLFPGKTELEVAEELAVHFNTISAEFEPLEPHQIPQTKPRSLPFLEPYQVAGRTVSYTHLTLPTILRV